MKKEMYIELQGLKFYAYHGVLEQEQRVGNTFIVDLRLELNHYLSCETDALEDTISYAEVYELVAQEMRQPSKLLEHIAGRCATAILAHSSMISSVRLRLTKMHPPMSGDLQSATIELVLSRD